MIPILSRFSLLTGVLVLLAACVYAGGGPQNVLVVVNGRSPESMEIGNTYRRARGIPYRNLLTISTTPSFTVAHTIYLDEIEGPIREYLKSRQHTDEITMIVLTRGVPQFVQVDGGRATVSLLAAMDLPKATPTARIANPFYRYPTPFSSAVAPLKGMYLVTTLTGYNTRDIERLIAQGVAADGTAPEGRFVLQRSPHLGVAAQRDTVAILARKGLTAEIVSGPPSNPQGIIALLSGGVFSGLSTDQVATMTFAPGAIADLAQPHTMAATNLDESTPALYLPAGALVQAGLTGLHGVVADSGMDAVPAAVAPVDLLDRYTNGLSFAESIYAALPYLNWQNLVIGDPLTAPYARRPQITIGTGTEPLDGLTAIAITASAQIPGTTISRIDLYLDGDYLQTLYEPRNAQVTLRVADRILTAVMPPGGNLRDLLDALTERINTHPTLSGPDGVRAVPAYATGALQLIARTAGQEGNTIPVSIRVEHAQQATAELTARISSDRLVGGGMEPTAAQGIISFIGRRIKAGDEVTMRIGSDRFVYTVPEGTTTLLDVIDGLVSLAERSAALAEADGVRVLRHPQGMPAIILEARTPGEEGNAIPFQISVKTVAGSLLRVYPDMPSRLTGGHDGSAATASISFSIGEQIVKRTATLDTSKLSDGAHQLRAVAFDGSPSRVQGVAETTIQIKNTATPPHVALPDVLAPAHGTVEITPTVHESVVRVDLFIDGQLLGSSAEAPFTLRIPLAALGRGLHDLWAEGSNAEGQRYRTPITPLRVQVAPEVTRVTPDHTGLAGGTTHRIIGTGFQAGCQVRLAGVPVKTVMYQSPNMLEVVCDAGLARRGWVEVTNPDGTVGTLPGAFEYYIPRVAAVQITPPHDVIQPGHTTRFSAACTDQYGHPIDATVTWRATGGSMTANGLYTALAIPGPYLVHANHPDSTKTWSAPVSIGFADVDAGQINTWLALGPFPDTDYTGLETALIPETTVTPSHGDPMTGFAWKTLASSDPYLDLFKTYPQGNTNAVAYAHVYLHAPAPTDALLVFGSDDGIRVWLNSEQLYSQRVRRAADPNQATLAIRLQAGWNRLLVKVDQGTGSWGFYLRLLGRDKKPLQGLQYTLDLPPGMKITP